VNRWLDLRPVRYALAAAGPVAVAITHFGLSLVLLQLLSPAAFGSFSALLVVVQLGWGIWSALLCAPLPVFLTQDDPAARTAGEATLLQGNARGALCAVPVFALLGWALALPPGATAAFALFGGVSLLRWFGRAFAYVHGQQLRTVTSDIVYSGTVGIALLLTGWAFGLDLELACYLALLAGALAGLLPFGAHYLGRLRWGKGGLIDRYRPIWQGQSRWALLGVGTTEATANAHVYIVTALAGAAAYAPIAASALLLRPVNVAQNALADFERPQLARAIGAGGANLRRSLLVFRVALLALWAGTVAAGVLLFLLAPRLLFPPAYPLDFLVVASALWGLFALLRLLQTPESTLLQAAGEFRDLALASVWSGIASVAAVTVLVLTAGTLLSIGGVVAGAAVYLLWTWRYARRWLAARPGMTD
jgi:O-antigen/teichoic acid export membrane protein